jgi:maltose/maltodextrin transport system substrate-binding protein
VKHLLLALSAACLVPLHGVAWTNGELLIWMDGARRQGLNEIAGKFERDLGIRVSIETPQNITTSFPIAAQAGKGPDVVIWAHDKTGEWADSGLIAPVEVPPEFVHQFFSKAWEAVLHRGRFWAYPIALEAVTLIYNKALLDVPPPTQLSQLIPLDKKLRQQHPGVRSILWDYDSAYYSWGVFASAGAYVFARSGTDYEPRDVGVATPGAIQALTQIVDLVRARILPRYTTYSTVESLMGQAKVAMILSGPWAWSNLIGSGINFGLAPVPGVAGKLGRPFVGVSAAYVNRSSPNVNLISYFVENYLLSEAGLTAMNRVKPIGVPARLSLYRKLAKADPLVRVLSDAVDHGQVMPNIPQVGRLFSAVGAALQIATQGRASPEVVLRDAAAAMQEQ